MRPPTRLLFWLGIALLALATVAVIKSFAADLTFSWTDTQPGVTGYRLYVDSVENIAVDNIAPAARTVSVPQIADGKSHVYFLTAFNTEEESRVSDVVIVKPGRPVKVVGFGGM